MHRNIFSEPGILDGTDSCVQRLKVRFHRQWTLIGTRFRAAERRHAYCLDRQPFRKLLASVLWFDLASRLIRLSGNPGEALPPAFTFSAEGISIGLPIASR